jgi:hypothetical protein
MKASQIFSPSRFVLLIRQDFQHHYKLLLITAAGFCGGLFILLFMMKIVHGLHAWGVTEFFETFVIVFVISGVLYSGNAFPGLRSREKSYSFLLNPASVLEKFLLELTTRIIAFIVLIPLMYLAVFNLEGLFLQLIYPEFRFTAFSFFDVPAYRGGPWVFALAISCSLLALTLPFAGAAIFQKYPLVKTLFSVALLFFFHLFLIFFFMETLGFERYAVNADILWMRDEHDLIKFLTVYAVIANGVMVAVAYLKLKEREA